MKFPVFNPLYLFFLFLFLTIPTCCESYTPPENIALDCGASGLSSAPDGRNWIADIHHILPSSGNSSDRSSKPGLASTPPYYTARMSRSEFAYAFSLKSSGPIFIRLHFFPSSYQDFASSKAFFFVKANQFTLTNFSAYAVAAEEFMVKEYCIYVGEDKSVKITFTPSRTQPDAYTFINGIEVVSMPTNLYYVSDHERFYIGDKISWYNLSNDKALENVLRLNVGGNLLPPTKDTGMYRSWKADDEYVNEGGTVPADIKNTTKLRFTSIAYYSAPTELYLTARTMGSNKTKNQSYNLTWSLPLDPQSQVVPYLVRLHFCEFQPGVNRTGDREFNIYMANQTAEERADVIAWTGNIGRDIPIYRDYLVHIDPGKEKKQTFSLALQAAPESATLFSDVILNGLEIFKLSDSNHNLAGPNLDLLPPFSIANSTSRSTVSKMLIPEIIGGVFLRVVSFSVLVFYIFRRRRAKGSILYNGTKSSEGESLSLPANICRCFSLAEVVSASNNFGSTFITGEGGYSSVYKGKLPDGSLVAVKVLKEAKGTGEDYINEVASISKTSHINVVALRGFCYEKNRRALIYEFLPNGSLDKFMYDNGAKSCLEWETMYQIAVGTARGLDYLHRGCRTRIAHFDIKPQNILLDEEFCPKISDFGLAKLCQKKGSSIFMMDTRTFGKVSDKSDVYSYGMLVLDMAGARNNVGGRVTQSSELHFSHLMYESLQNNGTLKLHSIINNDQEEEIARKMIIVGLWCIQTSPLHRPSMSRVIDMLEGKLLPLQVPPKPLLFSPPRSTQHSSSIIILEGKDERVEAEHPLE
ncbi:Non-specific serine/threonine protein kinase [Bertholletia excelsa]